MYIGNLYNTRVRPAEFTANFDLFVFSISVDITSYKSRTTYTRGGSRLYVKDALVNSSQFPACFLLCFTDGASYGAFHRHTRRLTDRCNGGTRNSCPRPERVSMQELIMFPWMAVLRYVMVAVFSRTVGLLLKNFQANVWLSRVAGVWELNVGLFVY